jgi:S-adenosylmethionine hydrolase
VLYADRFGNLVTNLSERDLASLTDRRDRLELVVGSSRLPVVRTYSDVAPGAPCGLVGSSGRLELAVNVGRADELDGFREGAPVLLRVRR